MHWFLLQCCHKNLFGYLAFLKTSEDCNSMFPYNTSDFLWKDSCFLLSVTALAFTLQYQEQANWRLWFGNHTTTSASGIAWVGIWKTCFPPN